MGKISSGEKGKRTDILGRKIKIEKYGGWEEYQVEGNFIHTPVSKCTVLQVLSHPMKCDCEGMQAYSWKSSFISPQCRDSSGIPVYVPASSCIPVLTLKNGPEYRYTGGNPYTVYAVWNILIPLETLPKAKPSKKSFFLNKSYRTHIKKIAWPFIKSFKKTYDKIQFVFFNPFQRLPLPISLL